MQSYEILIHIVFLYFISKDTITVETHIRDPVSIRSWGLTFHYQNPLIMNTREAEIGVGFYIIGVAIFNSELKE